MKAIVATKTKMTKKSKSFNHRELKETMKHDIIAIMELMLEYSRIENGQERSKT